MSYRNLEFILAHMKKHSDDAFLWKFCRVDGKFRFCGHYDQHSTMVNEGEKATAAGSFSLATNGWRLMDSYSMTLKVGASEQDLRDLTSILVPLPRKTAASYWA